jgi:hypothetical protein
MEKDNMFEFIVLGSGFAFAFAAAVSPGPVQAFLLSSVVHNMHENPAQKESIQPGSSSFFLEETLFQSEKNVFNAEYY